MLKSEKMMATFMKKRKFIVRTERRHFEMREASGLPKPNLAWIWNRKSDTPTVC